MRNPLARRRSEANDEDKRADQRVDIEFHGEEKRALQQITTETNG